GSPAVPGAEVAHEGRAVPHLRERHDVPGDGQGDGAAAAAARPRRRVPRRADVLRADAPQHRVPAAGPPPGEGVRGDVRALRRRRDAVRVLRGDDPRLAPEARAADRRDRLPRPRAVGVPRGRAGRHRRRRVLPAPRHLPPDLPLAADAARRRPPAAAAAGGPRHRPRRAPGRRRVLRVRRDVRAEELRGVGRDVRGQGHRRPLDRGGDAVRGRQLLPDAHRRRAQPDALGRPDRPPGRDPGLHRGGSLMKEAMPTHLGMPSFPDAARRAVADTRLRGNLKHATTTIRSRREAAVAELDDWAEMREAGKQIKNHVLESLGHYLRLLEERVTEAGGTVHWARDAAEANRIVTDLVKATGETEVVKVKSMATQEIGLNEHLAGEGVTAYETDLAELIVQVGADRPSHILVPAVHRNRADSRDVVLRRMEDGPEGLTGSPAELAEAARRHLRAKFLSAKVAVAGVNFAVAETGTLVVLESEGNGRMCLTLPETLISVMGLEKVVPTWRALELFLQLLPRSSTAERM